MGVPSCNHASKNSSCHYQCEIPSTSSACFVGKQYKVLANALMGWYDTVETGADTQLSGEVANEARSSVVRCALLLH